MSENDLNFDYTIPEELSATDAYELCDVAEGAFGRDGKPSFKDTMKHLVDSSRLLVLRDGETPIGFSSALMNPPVEGLETEGNYVVHHAAALNPEYQGGGLSRVMSDLSTMFDVENGGDEKYTVVGRTAHPAFFKYYDMMEKIDGDMPEIVEQLSDFWPGELEEGFLLKESFEEELYSDEEFDEFGEELMDLFGVDYRPEEGDAFLVYEETVAPEKFGLALENADKSEESFGEGLYEQVKKKYLQRDMSESLQGFYDVFTGKLGGEPMSPASKPRLEDEVRKNLEEIAESSVEESPEVLWIGPGSSELPRKMASSFPELSFVCAEPSEEMASAQRELLEGLENAEVLEETVHDYLQRKESLDKGLTGAFGVNSVQETTDPVNILRRVNDLLETGGRAVYTYPGPGTKRPLVEGEAVDRLTLDVGEHPAVDSTGLHPWNRFLDQQILTEEDEKLAFEGVELLRTDNLETSGGKKIGELAAANDIEGFEKPEGAEGGVRMAVVAKLLEKG